MSVNVNLETTINLPWIIIVIFLMSSSTRAFSIKPSSGDWSCSSDRILPNRTLSGGIQAGQFKKVGEVSGMFECIRYCCNDEKCNVALMAKSNCYLVSCNNEALCQPVPAQSTDLSPSLSFVQHKKENQKKLILPELHTFLTEPERPLSRLHSHRKLKDHLYPFDKTFDAYGNKHVRGPALHSAIVSLEPSASLQGHLNDTSNQKVIADGCYPSTIYRSVSLLYGPDSGDFFDYGKIGDMRQCVNLCCKDKQCNVAFMVDTTCYTVSCYTFEKCVMVPASKTAKLTSLLAYVIKKTDIDRKEKLKISKQHELFLIEKRKESEQQRKESKQQNWSVHKNIDSHFSASNEISLIEEPNVPEGLTQKCRHNRVMSNHAMVEGQKAGVYTFRGVTPGFNACLDLCCADLFCDAAFLLGKRCYSIQCYKDKKCTSKPVKSKSIHSTLVFLERNDDGLDASEKRTAIPGILPTDRQYIVRLNITNEEFKNEMTDSESLEFLNFAETLRGMLTDLYGDVEGFKFVEIIDVKPQPLITIFNLTVDQNTSPKLLLQKIVGVLRKGELKSFSEPLSERLSVDVRGFQFLNADGQNLVCQPEFNYEVHWPLGIFDTFVSIPCPRKANGLTTRSCSTSKTSAAFWKLPDFSDCVTDKYESLLREVQLLSSTSIHTPDLTTASIIDRLLQHTVEDTYGSKPPMSFGTILSLQKDESSSLAKPEQEVNVAQTVAGKESIPEDQLKSYLKKMGLSALLGKTNKLDLLSLYKMLSSEVSEEDKSKAQKTHGSSSIKYPNPKIEKEVYPGMSYQNYPDISNAKKRINMLSEQVESNKYAGHHKKANPIEIIKSHKQVSSWSLPKPIGDIGAESPFMHSASKLESLPLTNSNRMHNPSSVIPLSHTVLHNPATIERIDYEPNLYPLSQNTILNNRNRVLTSEDLMNLTPEELHEAITAIQKSQLKHSEEIPIRKSNTLNNLASYFTNNQVQPNGIPMFQSRRDEPSYPSLEEINSSNGFQHSIRKRNLEIEDKLNHVLRYIKKRIIKNQTIIDTEKKKVNYPATHVKRNIDSLVLESLGEPEIPDGMTRLYGSATLTEIPFSQENSSNKLGVTRSDLPALDKHGIQKKGLQNFRSYKNTIEEPVIVDIPTGHIIDNHLLKPSQLNKHFLTVRNMTYDKNKEIKLSAIQISDNNKLSSSSSVTLHVSKPISLTTDSLEKQKRNLTINSVKMTSSINIKCTEGYKDCNHVENMSAFPDSKVIEETQVNESVPATFGKEPEYFSTQKITSTSTNIKHTTHPTVSKKTTQMTPTADPYKQEADETENALLSNVFSTTLQPVVNSSKTFISITAIETKHKPEISITVLNKTVNENVPLTIKPVEKNRKEESDLIFSYDKDDGGDRAPMFGGDILMTINIAEEILKYMQDQYYQATLQEVEEFLQAASALIDENNENEWKNAMKLKEEKDILMGFVNTVETYGKSTSQIFVHYDVKQPIITKNIILQVRVIVVDDLLEKENNAIVFPEYKDERLAKCCSGVEKISLPASLITDRYERSKSVTFVFFKVKNIAFLQRTSRENEDSEISNEKPIKVASQLLSLSVNPPLEYEFKEPVSLTFANDDLSQANLPHDCAYWNSTRSSWEDNGCDVTFTNASITTCQCYHLTTFSVLVDSSHQVSTTEKPELLPESTPPEIKINKEKLDEFEDRFVPIKVETLPTTIPTTVPSTLPSTVLTMTVETTPQPDSSIKPSAGSQKQSEKKKNWLILVLAILIALIILLLCICCICIWYRRRKKHVEEQPAVTEEDHLESSEGTRSLIDKANSHEAPKRGLVKSGSTTTTRSCSSPEMGQSPGWRKLMSNAQHPKQLLLKEKAILFKDYVQPYHFLSRTNERPNSSLESIYGSTVGSGAAKSDQHSSPSRKIKRSYEPNGHTSSLQSRKKLNSTRESPIETQSSISSEVIEKEARKRAPNILLKKKDLEESVIPGNLGDAHSMEWDPYLDNKHQKSKNRRKKRHFSPINEEGEESMEPKTSIEAQIGSDDSQYSSSDTSYPDSVTRSEGEYTDKEISQPTSSDKKHSELTSSPKTLEKGGKARFPRHSLGDQEKDLGPRDARGSEFKLRGSEYLSNR